MKLLRETKQLCIAV